MAPAQGTMNNLTFGNDACQYYETIAGGSGAGPGFDGTSVIQTHMTNSRMTDPEVMETRFRSEEHTSELQSLMRISYAVFCLKKKIENKKEKTKNTKTNDNKKIQ